MPLRSQPREHHQHLLVEGVHLQHLLHLTAELLSYESYLEYYTHRQDLDPPLTNVMDMFKSTTGNDPYSYTHL